MTLPHLGVLVGQVGAAVLVNTVVRQVSEHVGERAEEEDVKMIYRSNSARKQFLETNIQQMEQNLIKSACVTYT